MKKHLFLTLTALVTLVLTSCSKKDDAPAKSSHKVVFKAQTSSDSRIEIAVYGYDTKTTTASSLSGSTWTSPELTVPAGTAVANVSVSGIGVNASSSLKVQIFVDGVMKSEGTSTGEALSAGASFQF